MNSIEKHILLVDDDPDDRDFFRHALTETRPDYKLTTIADGRDLKGVLRQIPPPNVIVIDYSLPVKSGKELLNEIRADRKYDEIPVIILSAYTSQATINDCFANGADQYFIKPGTYGELRNIVDRICIAAATG